MKIILAILACIWTVMLFDEKSSANFKTYAGCYGLTLAAIVAFEIMTYIFKG